MAKDLFRSAARKRPFSAAPLGVAGASIVDRADIGYAAAKTRIEKALAEREAEA